VTNLMASSGTHAVVLGACSFSELLVGVLATYFLSFRTEVGKGDVCRVWREG
jgi:hypothetical protein